VDDGAVTDFGTTSLPPFTAHELEVLATAVMHALTVVEGVSPQALTREQSRVLAERRATLIHLATVITQTRFGIEPAASQWPRLLRGDRST